MSKPSSSQGTVVEEGSYVMTFRTVADIGTQTMKKFGSEDEEEEKKQLILVTELPEESTKDKPVTLSSWVTNSVGKKATLAKILKAAGLDNDCDLDDLLGKSVLGTVEHTDSGRAKITGWAPLKKGQKAPKGFLQSSSVYLDETFDNEAFEGMPEFIQNAIIKSPEFEKIDAKRKKKKK